MHLNPRARHLGVFIVVTALVGVALACVCGEGGFAGRGNASQPERTNGAVAPLATVPQPWMVRIPNASGLSRASKLYEAPTFEAGRRRAQWLLDKKYRRFEQKLNRACPDQAFVSDVLDRARRANERIAFAAAETAHGVRTKREQLKLEMDLTEEMYDIVCAKVGHASPGSVGCEMALPMCSGGRFIQGR